LVLENDMTWVTQNWPYLLLPVALVLFLSWRNRTGRGLDAHHAHGGPQPANGPTSDPASQAKEVPKDGAHRHGGHGHC
jgi:hypothetical protein